MSRIEEPGGWRASFHRAQTLDELGRHDEALRFAQRAIAEAPHEASTHCLLASILSSLGRNEEALAATSRALEADPAEEWAFRLRASLFLSTGRKRDARQAAEEAVRLRPGSEAGWWILGDALLQSGELEEAREIGERIRAANPDRVVGHRLLALVALEEKRWAEAEAHLRTALGIEPESSGTLQALAQAVEKQGRSEEAIRLGHQAARTDPSSPSARRNLGESVESFADAGWIVAISLAGLAGWVFFRKAEQWQLSPWISLPIGAATVGGILLGFHLVREARLRRLHPTIRRVHEDDASPAETIEAFQQISAVVGVVLAVVAGLAFLEPARFRSPIWLSAIGLLTISLVALLTLWRRMRR